MRRELAIDLDSHRIDPEGRAFGEGHEYGDLRVGRIEQLFLETTQLRGNAQNVSFDLLDLFVQALHLLLGVCSCAGRKSAGRGQQGEDQDASDPWWIPEPRAFVRNLPKRAAWMLSRCRHHQEPLVWSSVPPGHAFRTSTVGCCVMRLTAPRRKPSARLLSSSSPGSPRTAGPSKPASCFRVPGAPTQRLADSKSEDLISERRL